MNEKVKKIVKWIAVIAAAIGAAAAVIIEQGCTHKHHLKASGIKIDTIEVSTTTRYRDWEGDGASRLDCSQPIFLKYGYNKKNQLQRHF